MKGKRVSKGGRGRIIRRRFRKSLRRHKEKTWIKVSLMTRVEKEKYNKYEGGGWGVIGTEEKETKFNDSWNKEVHLPNLSGEWTGRPGLVLVSTVVKVVADHEGPTPWGWNWHPWTVWVGHQNTFPGSLGLLRSLTFSFFCLLGRSDVHSVVTLTLDVGGGGNRLRRLSGDYYSVHSYIQ